MQTRPIMMLGLLITTAALTVRAEVNHSWSQLMESLKPGKKIVVTQMDGKKVEGKLTSMTEESVTVTDEYRDRTATVQREDVFRVRFADIRQKRTLIGLGLGALGGVIYGSQLGTHRHGLSATVFGGLFGGIGAAAGGAIPIGAPLYEAPGGLRRK
jgi:hypothetical protein